MKIVLATDGSESSEDAAKFLNHFRFSPGDEIIALHVITEIPYDDDSLANIRRFLKKVAPRILRSSVSVLQSVNAKVSVIEEEGTPDSIIIKVAEDSGADLIVMGARGIKGIKSLFIGSVTRSVAINSLKPVLITKPSPQVTSEGMKVLFATDGSAPARATAGLLSSLPFPDDTELTLMHVGWSPASDLPERFFMEIDDKMKADLTRVRMTEFEKSKDIIHQARSLLSRRFFKIRETIKGGDPSEEILKEAEIVKPHLIAMGNRGLRGIRGMMGSVSRRILGHAQCHLLIGKAAEGSSPVAQEARERKSEGEE
jgi:nucleotide-binding universal stress UspA family protein